MNYSLCSNCEKNTLDTFLAPICCQEHQYCVDCYCELVDPVINQTCYCCYRWAVYQQGSKEGQVIQPGNQFNSESSETGKESPTYTDEPCQKGENRGNIDNLEVDHILEYKDFGIKISAFHLNYVHEHLIPPFDPEDPDSILDGINFDLLSNHAPLYTYYVPILFAQYEDLDRQGYMNDIKSVIHSTLATYLNVFRSDKIVSIQALSQLVLARQEHIKNFCKKYRQQHFNILFEPTEAPVELLPFDLQTAPNSLLDMKDQFKSLAFRVSLGEKIEFAPPPGQLPGLLEAVQEIFEENPNILD